MAFRFWKRKKITGGLSVNLSKSGGSLSFGPRGAKFTVGSRGGRTTAGIPGTGMFYTSRVGGGNKGKKKRRGSGTVTPEVPPEERLNLGFFKRLFTPAEEEALVDGCRELVAGNEKKAMRHLRKATHLADGAYLAGFLALKRHRFKESEKYLKTALKDYRRLGRYFSKYGISMLLNLPITGRVSAHVGPDLRGVLLALVELYQYQKRWHEAMECLERLRRLEPEDVVVKLSLAELLMEARPGDKKTCRRIVRLCKDVENETPIHTSLLYYKAKALRELGLSEAARDTLTYALRRRKGRSDELRRALRYERILAYRELGKKSRVREECEKLYAEDPDYQDVARLLGLEE